MPGHNERGRKEGDAVGEIDRGKEFAFYSNSRIQYLSSIILFLEIQPVLQGPHDTSKYSLQHHQKMIASEYGSSIIQ